MPMEVEIKLSGFPADATGEGLDIYRMKMGQALRLSLDKIKNEAKKLTPVNNGALAKSIEWLDYHTTGGEMYGIVSTPLQYGIPIEYGTAPHWVPIAPLKLWAKRVFGDESVAYAVQKAIARRGTKGRFMFRQGFAMSKRSINTYFQAAAKGIVREWSKIKARALK